MRFHLFPLSVYLLDWPGLGGFAEGISDLHSGDLAGKVGLLGLGRFEWWMLRSFVRWLVSSSSCNKSPLSGVVHCVRVWVPTKSLRWRCNQGCSASGEGETGRFHLYIFRKCSSSLWTAKEEDDAEEETESCGKHKNFAKFFFCRWWRRIVLVLAIFVSTGEEEDDTRSKLVDIILMPPQLLVV